jgi:hypothetical protein
MKSSLNYYKMFAVAQVLFLLQIIWIELDVQDDLEIGGGNGTYYMGIARYYFHTKVKRIY